MEIEKKLAFKAFKQNSFLLKSIFKEYNALKLFFFRKKDKFEGGIFSLFFFEKVK